MKVLVCRHSISVLRSEIQNRKTTRFLRVTALQVTGRVDRARVRRTGSRRMVVCPRGTDPTRLWAGLDGGTRQCVNVLNKYI